ncbi:MAG: tripartite tricarboxylate transporter TctB family protein [Rhodospirillales bacterium]|nr:tripartite tricarboxylate transporter TctB family protein [Rhodospirillales bacterium]MBO6787044.1 tripartite tricarboxylate transporter TctB family protein [Rhodospirillales bacterium]
MRRAEIITAGLMALLSIYLMYKSTELDIGYVRGEGPGGGFWPFWLAAGMLISCVWIAINWVLRKSPPSQSDEEYLDSYGLRMLLLVGGGVTGFIALCHILGFYGAILVFLIYYIRFLGRHTWPATLAIAIGTPIVTFLFFDIAMRIVLPKGYLEPLFLPLYDFFF